MADENCHKTLQTLSLLYTSLKSNQLYHFHIFHKARIVRNLYTIEITENF
jgi:hypothetical protein